MNFRPRSRLLDARKILRDEKGFVLIVALTLLATLTLLGTTAYVLTSTDIKVGGNFKSSQKVLQIATAGAERGRERLRFLNASTGNENSFDDELSAMAGSNAVLDGYASGTDDDPLFATDSLENISYVAYLTNDTGDGPSNQTDSNNKVLITSVATGPGGSFAKIEIEVIRNNLGPPIEAPIYSVGDVTGNGSSMTIDGNDNCGAGSNLPPIYTKDPATTDLNGSPTLDGDPPTPQTGPVDIDIAAYVADLEVGATALTDPSTADFGDPSNHVMLYSEPDPNPPTNGELDLNNVTGYGTLLVNGDLTLSGGFQWNGLILVTGTLTFNGGGSGINIQGAVLSNNTVDINGGVSILYDSCEVDDSVPPPAMKAVSWKQVY